MIECKVPIPDTEWVYVGKDKDGKPKLKRLTHESAEFVADMLNEREIPFEFKPGAHMFRVYNPKTHQWYQYFYTTGKWGVYYYSKRPEKHYHSKGVEDFITRYLLKEQNDN